MKKSTIHSILLSAFFLAACNEEIATISKDEFDQLTKGMTYKEVKEVVGGAANTEHVVSEDKNIIEYDYESDEGSDITLLFIDNKLDTKIGFKEQSHKETENVSKKEQKPVNHKTWEEEINEIANNNDPANEKFYTLEKYMMNYQANDEEVKKFKNDIINNYKSGKYLSEIENHARMLTNIFKSYIVEKNSDGALADFAFDYHQNLKYTYRGADEVDSEAVKANEDQMNKALREIE